MRRQLLITRMRDVALEGTIISNTEIEQEYRKKNEKIKIQWVKSRRTSTRRRSQPTAQEMQDYFKANASKYTVPETRNVAMLIVDQSKLESAPHPPDARTDAPVYPEPGKVPRAGDGQVAAHSPEDQGKTPEEEAKLKAQADDLLKQVKSGGKFADLAKKFSEDTTNANTRGEISVARGQMLPESEQAAFSLKPGESAVVKTSIGFDLIQVIQHDQAHLKTFDEVKADLASRVEKTARHRLHAAGLRQGRSCPEEGPRASRTGRRHS